MNKTEIILPNVMSIFYFKVYCCNYFYEEGQYKGNFR